MEATRWCIQTVAMVTVECDNTGRRVNASGVLSVTTYSSLLTQGTRRGSVDVDIE